MSTINSFIDKLNQLLDYAIESSISEDGAFILSVRMAYRLKLEKPLFPQPNTYPSLTTLLDAILDDAFKLGYFPINSIAERDNFEAAIFDILMPTSNEVTSKFRRLYKVDKEAALAYFYNLSIRVNYIKKERLNANIEWSTPTQYGPLDITINLAKPEKDPKDIIAQRTNPLINTGAPLCALCKENVGYYPAARMNLRIIPIRMGKESWYLQYSPYAYYPEHCIVLHNDHRPMKITPKTYVYLFDFLDQFPMYFIGSNADLPIVGGSILSHDHFQGGRHEFPLFRAENWYQKTINNTVIQLLKWPLSTIRLVSNDRKELTKLGTKLMQFWNTYEDKSIDIIPYTDAIPHHTVTPIARKKEDTYILDIILRDNRTNETHPDGIFHPHKEKHHIKKENIGLIEASGLAILPGRLKEEMQVLLKFQNKPFAEWPELIRKHGNWLKTLPKPMTQEALNAAIGLRFLEVIQDAGVFKDSVEGRSHFQLFLEQWVATLPDFH